MIRIDFPGYSGEGSLEPISWDQWFGKFDQKKLALILQDETSGGEKSNFNKLVARKTAAGRARRPHARATARKPAKKRPAKSHSTRRTTARRASASRAKRK